MARTLRSALLIRGRGLVSKLAIMAGFALGGQALAGAAGNPSGVTSLAPLTAPVVSGLNTPGTASTLTATSGTYNDPSATISGQWQKNGVAIPGATSPAYVTLPTDGPNVTYVETATNAGGSVTQRAPCQYRGQVANRCWIPDTYSSISKQFMSRSPHIACDNITSLQLYFANWYADRAGGKTEIGSGGNQTYTASIEYPAGTFTQVKFGGATSGTIGTFAALVSDSIPVSIPKGALFWVRAWCNAASGICFNGSYTSGTSAAFSSCDLANGQALTYGAAGIADQTMGGTVVNTSTSNYPSWTPLAIVSTTAVPSVVIYGTSREKGTGDVLDGTMAGLGETARQLDLLGLPWIDAGLHGDLMATAATNFAKRKGIATVVSHAFSEGGINDVTANNSNPLTNLQTIWGQLPAYIPVFQATLSPVSTSTDNWATTANQTTHANNATRVSFNTTIRAGGVSGLSGYFEDADVVESARNSGLWKPNLTSDGTHANPTGYLAYRNSGTFSATTFAR